ncbi:zinc finger and BTB domain-containing protein 17 isoform X1 [Babesia caballi]|uniref:Zinc finger and BTB domain-containing protein 17 isoform X1 n=1 Tax=Babesia caballi TaxID=5871 RepID=A0AAV4LP02_BABCB|nr:zinc finger and BTB domain-containing protein 17 isoform X1 [Babesia caballi]
MSRNAECPIKRQSHFSSPPDLVQQLDALRKRALPLHRRHRPGRSHRQRPHELGHLRVRGVDPVLDLEPLQDVPQRRSPDLLSHDEPRLVQLLRREAQDAPGEADNALQAVKALLAALEVEREKLIRRVLEERGLVLGRASADAVPDDVDEPVDAPGPAEGHEPAEVLAAQQRDQPPHAVEPALGVVPLAYSDAHLHNVYGLDVLGRQLVRPVEVLHLLERLHAELLVAELRQEPVVQLPPQPVQQLPPPAPQQAVRRALLVQLRLVHAPVHVAVRYYERVHDLLHHARRLRADREPHSRLPFGHAHRFQPFELV